MDKRFHERSDWGEYPHPPIRRLLPLLLIPIGIGIAMNVKRNVLRHAMHRHSRWENGVPPMFAELHRRAHEAEKQAPVTEA